jgi:flagellar hook-length control protein FliK
MASGAVSGTAGDASNAVTSNPITDQVFGQVTRLVSRGDGTHRLTLRLHPADLGEVKVVLTVKDGAVDVTLSAGAAARDALREGSPQLRALLELAGATTGQVTVRDLATGAVTSSTNAGQQQPAGTGADQQRSPHPDAAWADGTADGGPDGGPGAGAGAGADGQTGSHDSTPLDAPRAGRGGGPATAAQHGVPSRTATRLDLNI